MNVHEWRAPVIYKRLSKSIREHEHARTTPKVGTVYHNKQGRVSGKGIQTRRWDKDMNGVSQRY